MINTQPPHVEAGAKRTNGEFYTPDALALAVCKTLHEQGISPGYVLEPGCGGGAFLRAARETWPRADLMGVDLAPACTGPGLVSRMDLFSLTWSYDLILGNPDFSRAEEIVRHCLGLRAPGGYLAFLLRLNMLGGIGRASLYAEYPLWLLQPIAGRPSFTSDGKTDSSDYGLFVWREGHTGPGKILQPLIWR